MSYRHRTVYRNSQRRFPGNSRNIKVGIHIETWLSVILLLSTTCLVGVNTATTAAAPSDCFDEPPAIGNGYALNVGAQDNGTLAVYVCDQGYTLTGNVNSVKCTMGVWEGVRPRCELPESSNKSYVTIPDIILYSAIGLGGLLVLLLVIVITFCCCFFCKSRKPNHTQSINPMMPRRRYYGHPPPDQPQKMVVPVVAAKY